MNRISAAENLIIETGQDYWRLLTPGDTGEEQVLFEAASGRSLRYTSEFASSRRLPGNGVLPVDYVWQVVLGWSHDDEAWHLGLLLARDLANARGSRWCELARWPGDDPEVFADLARDAGKALARTLGRPLNLIPAREPKVVQEPPLPELPLEIGQWKLERVSDDALQFQRSRKWVVSRLMRIAWYLLWIVVYIILSVATLRTDLALPNAGTMLPNPELLPYLGLAAAGVLFIMTLYTIYELISRPNRIVIDGPKHRVLALHGSTRRWQMNGRDMQSIYVTQVVNKKGKKRTVYHGEINLHLGNGAFRRIVQQPQQETEIIEGNAPEPPQEAVMPLTPFDVTTELQAAGLHMAKMLGGLPCWYDQRTR